MIDGIKSYPIGGRVVKPRRRETKRRKIVEEEEEEENQNPMMRRMRRIGGKARNTMGETIPLFPMTKRRRLQRKGKMMRFPCCPVRGPQIVVGGEHIILRVTFLQVLMGGELCLGDTGTIVIPELIRKWFLVGVFDVWD